MIEIALIRHGPTEWNAEKRLQGRADKPLSAEGRAEVARWSLPERLRGFAWVSSPLSRARETARLLGLDATIEPSLIEMNWGRWEGRTREELIAVYGEEFTRRTERGIDLRPHDGESPREVRARVHGWMRAAAASGRPVGAVCHQGIIRAALSLATGWSMVGKPPVRFDWAAAHIFRAGDDGTVTLHEMNLSLIGPPR